MHLQDDELVDLADGTRPESSSPHLSSCEPCRRQVRDMRAMMAAAADVDVPEPSPLYWDHLSARVRESVAGEAPLRRPWLDVAAWRRVVMPAGAAAVASIIIAVVLGSRLLAPSPSPAVPAAAAVTVAEAVDLWSEPASEDDESLTIMASLSAGLDLEAAGEAGLAVRGSADHAVTHMDDDDLRELQRLLTQELAPSGVRPRDLDLS
jgi:hypothetical protein